MPRGIRLLLFLASPGLLCPATFAQSRGERAGQTAESLVAAGDDYAQQKQYDRAVESYKQAISLQPDLAAAYRGLGTSYLNMSRVPDARETLKTAVRLDPANGNGHLNLGVALAILRQNDEAMAELNEARRLLPQNPRVLNQIGNVLHNNLGQIEGALAAYREAAWLDPKVPELHQNVGLMLMRLGRFAEAVGPLEEALRLNPKYGKARYHLSHAYNRVRRYEDAVVSWTKFLDLEPGTADLKEALHNRAWNELYVGGRGDKMAADAQRFLQAAGWQDPASQFMVLLAHFGYRQVALDTDARAVIEEAAKRCDTRAWPYPVLTYMQGGLTADALLSMATTNDRKTEAHGYIGMDLLLRGRIDDARTHFEWVKTYGNERFLEYPLALSELERMGR